MKIVRIRKKHRFSEPDTQDEWTGVPLVKLYASNLKRYDERHPNRLTAKHKSKFYAKAKMKLSWH